MKEIRNYQMAIQAIEENLDEVRQYVQEVVRQEFKRREADTVVDGVMVWDDIDMGYTSTDGDGYDGELVLSYENGRGIDNDTVGVVYTAWGDVCLGNILEILTDTDFLTWEAKYTSVTVYQCSPTPTHPAYFIKNVFAQEVEGESNLN